MLARAMANFSLLDAKSPPLVLSPPPSPGTLSPFERRLDTPDSAWFAELCERYMHPEPMPALASRTIQAAMVHNVVGSVWYGCMVESGRIQRYLPSAYVRNFTSVVIRWANPYVTMLLFSNGFAVVVGAMSPEEFLCAVHLGRNELLRMGYQPTLRYFSVDNTVASGHVPFTIDLENYDAEGCCLEWDPSIFPGGILTVYEPHSVVLLFTSGSFMLTGLRTKKDCDTVYCHILRIAERFRANTNGGATAAARKKKTGNATAVAPVKRKAQARESRKLITAMERESASSSNRSNSQPIDADAEAEDMVVDDGTQQQQQHQQQQQPSAASLTKAQKKEFLRRAHICSRGVRGYEKIQAIHRAVLTQYLSELKEEADRKAAAKTQKKGNGGKRAPRQKLAPSQQGDHEKVAIMGILMDADQMVMPVIGSPPPPPPPPPLASLEAPNPSDTALATLASFVDPQTLQTMRETALSAEIMDAIDEFSDHDVE